MCSRHVHVIACPLPNIVYPCCFSSPRKTFSFYFTLSCSQNRAITSFPMAVLREFPMLNYRKACAKHSHAGIVFTQWFKYKFFAPQGRHVIPINVKFGRRSAPPCAKFCLSGQKCGNTAPKTVKILNFDNKFVPQGRLDCTIFTTFSGFVRVYR